MNRLLKRKNTAIQFPAEKKCNFQVNCRKIVRFLRDCKYNDEFQVKQIIKVNFMTCRRLHKKGT